MFASSCEHRNQQPQSTTPLQATAPTIEAEAASFSAVLRVGPAALYADSNLTPGKAATLAVADLTARYTDHCPSGKADCTYSQSHRDVSSAKHKAIYDEYKVPAAERNIQDGEVDHLYPLCAGGSNDAANLWYQPVINKWKGKNFGYHEKDALEAYVCREIVAGNLDPKVAYKRITTDWIKWYIELHLDQSPDGQDADLN
jgi:hypothetical protein